MTTATAFGHVADTLVSTGEDTCRIGCRCGEQWEGPKGDRDDNPIFDLLAHLRSIQTSDGFTTSVVMPCGHAQDVEPPTLVEVTNAAGVRHGCVTCGSWGTASNVCLHPLMTPCGKPAWEPSTCETVLRPMTAEEIEHLRSLD